MPQINRRFTDFSGFPVRSVSSPIFAVMSRMRDASRKFAIATTRRKSFVTNFGSNALSSAFLRRCNVDSAFLKSGRCLTGIVSEPTKFERIQPVATIYIEFFFCGNMGVVFVRQSVHLADHFFSATQFEHSLSEPCITDKSIVNVLVFSFYAHLLEFICRVVFFTTFFLPVPPL